MDSTIFLRIQFYSFLQFFDHPIIIGIMNERWHGDRRIAFVASRPFLWWLFLNLWCLIDIVFFPISFFLAFVAGDQLCVASVI